MTKNQIGKAQRARLKQACSALTELDQNLRFFTRIGFEKERMAICRDSAEELLQCLHEYSAYQNVLTAETKESL